jgi:hypothetical protein
VNTRNSCGDSICEVIASQSARAKLSLVVGAVYSRREVGLAALKIEQSEMPAGLPGFGHVFVDIT